MECLGVCHVRTNDSDNVRTQQPCSHNYSNRVRAIKSWERISPVLTSHPTMLASHRIASSTTIAAYYISIFTSVSISISVFTSIFTSVSTPISISMAFIRLGLGVY